MSHVPSLGQSILELSTDNTKLDKGLKDAKKGADDLEAHFKDVGKLLLGVGGATAGAITALVKSAANYGDELAKAKERTGLATAELAKLRFAAEQSGSSFDGITTAMKMFARTTDEARRGSTEQMKAFRELGISVTDSHGKMKPLNVLFGEVADRFSRMDDGVDKTTSSMKLFGKAGADIIPTLNLGSAGLKEMGDMAEHLGLVMTDDATAASEEFNDTVDQAMGAVRGLGIVLATQLLPAFTSTATTVREIIVDFSAWVKEHETLTKGVLALALGLVGAGGLAFGIGSVMGAVGTLTTGFGVLATGVKAVGLAIAGLGPGAIAVAMAALVALTYKIADATGLIDKLALKIADWTGASKVAVDANKDLESATNAAARVLFEKYGVSIDRGSKSLDAYNKEVLDALRSHQGLKTAQEQAGPQQEKFTLKVEQSESAVKKMADAMKEAHTASDRLTKEALKNMEEEGDNAIAYWTKIYQQELDAKIKALDTIQDILAKNRTAMAQHEEQMLEDSSERLKYQTDIYVDEMDRRSDSLKKQEAHNAEFLRKQHEETIKELKASAGEIFDMMFLNGENVFTNLKNALKGGALSLGRTIFQDITAELFAPLKKAFDDFFRGLMESLGIKKFFSDLGSKLGSTISGALGLGGGAAGAGAGAAGAGGAGAAGGVAGGGGAGAAGIGAFLTNPWTIGIGAAIGITTAWLKSQAHHEASKFVKEFQDPFVNTQGTGVLNQISNAFAAAESAGELTIDAAEEAKVQVAALWEEWQAKAEEFGRKGSDEFKVMTQAFATMRPFMRGIFDDMERSIERLKMIAASGTQSGGSSGSGGSTQPNPRGNAILDPVTGMYHWENGDPIEGFELRNGARLLFSNAAFSNRTHEQYLQLILQTAGSAFLGFFDQGADRIKRTGIGVLHEGEGVLTKEQNERRLRGEFGSAVFNIYQQPGESGEALARRLIRMIHLNRYGLADAVRGA